MPLAPLALLGFDVKDLVTNAFRALIDLIVPDFGAQWASHLVTWLVALPPITGDAFPALNRYAHDLTAVGFGILGATFAATAVQLAAGTSQTQAADVLKRTAIAAGMLGFYPTLMASLITGVNLLTASLIRQPVVTDGLDKAFGEALVVAVITGGVSLGLAAGAAIVVLYFVAALFVMKIGLTAGLAIAALAGALVWGLYPLPQTQWLPRAWGAALVAAITVPIAWACVFTAAALLASDTLAFGETSSINRPLGEGLANLVKPFAAVACFWLAYRAPGFLMGLARTAGVSTSMLRLGGGGGGGGGDGRGPAGIVTRGVQTNADRFRVLTHRATTAVRATGAANTATKAARTIGATRPVAAARKANAAWRALPSWEAPEAQAAQKPKPGTAAPAPKQQQPTANKPHAPANGGRTKAPRSKPKPAAPSRGTAPADSSAPRAHGPAPQRKPPTATAAPRRRAKPPTPKPVPSRKPSPPKPPRKKP